MTIEDMLTLRNEGRTIPYLTGEEAKLLLEEIVRLRKQVNPDDVRDSFLRGALAARSGIAEYFFREGHPAPAGMARSFDVNPLADKAFAKK